MTPEEKLKWLQTTAKICGCASCFAQARRYESEILLNGALASVSAPKKGKSK